MMIYGSHVFLVVRTVIDPSTKFNSHPTPTSFKAFVIDGHTSLKYFSRYFGNNVAKEDSSNSPCGLSSCVNFGTSQWSIPAWSHGFSRRYRPFLPPPSEDKGASRFVSSSVSAGAMMCFRFVSQRRASEKGVRVCSERRFALPSLRLAPKLFAKTATANDDSLFFFDGAKERKKKNERRKKDV